ncbi:hypothetical protein CO083_01430 [Candidatus Roizmanbacteria bacterium CG_4_9_14_0_8_um_filter_34_12]|uniref:Uncharacterized protein n=4 Tax=Candidatus Roizmaniibacteriota TaxID=1752723 RepID=A0A2M7E366_9BACT|nr:MAG: hypothetical protein COW96_03315 [Candidatus Roizmanbacteria bacterium CG22_combo_CG10-13_8_21_14_all_33_16]PIV62166.1 MAG: hypothetical protein COS12_03365 [Candidatus Roizmanbacteria bacterium CG01_land_8_20_14_3_00_33_9]PIX72508.1 MAG: hypothetical protein COZ39_02840 [Candidatus Roizmanbacteria bacterium CG_4_10_14_3_um_filter_33_21]PJB89018.1 MAG: hypothetical protein CO083_01430 [Candidatus Roizmanbacteria bacterium CG_4_9_14_0_8_um_filter_34_12]
MIQLDTQTFFSAGIFLGVRKNTSIYGVGEGIGVGLGVGVGVSVGVGEGVGVGVGDGVGVGGLVVLGGFSLVESQFVFALIAKACPPLHKLFSGV